jgi:hypothetical protein
VQIARKIGSTSGTAFADYLGPDWIVTEKPSFRNPNLEHHLKTKDGAGQITVDKEVIDELNEIRGASQSPFIIRSGRPPRNNSARPHYRCEPVFESLILRSR